LGADEGAQESGVTAISAGERQFAEELGHPLVEDGAVVATGPVAQRRGKPTLSDAGRSREDQIIMGVDP